MKIPFFKYPNIGKQEEYLIDSFKSGHHSGNGYYTQKCQKYIEDKFLIKKTLLTTSCTDALEMASFLIGANIIDGEFIVPSYTFSSTANAFVYMGLKPVFCDIRIDTLNIDENKIENLITEKTKCIVVIHYAGIPCEMDKINDIAKKHKIPVIEDAAQAFNSKYYNKYCGSLSDLGTFSFHASKSYSSGEGGALTINNKKFIERSEFLWEKGTDRSQVVKGLKNKYSWVDYGSSFLPSDLLASILYAQLETIDESKMIRKKLHDSYESTFSDFKKYGISFIDVPSYVDPNYHAFWILFDKPFYRDKFIELSLNQNISPYIGYIPLHSSPMGKKIVDDNCNLKITDFVSETVCRLPFYLMDDLEINYVNESFKQVLLKMY